MAAERTVPGGPAPPAGRFQRFLLRCLRVPREPPELPRSRAENVEIFLPAAAYLRYLRCEAVVTALVIAAGLGVSALLLWLEDQDVAAWLAIGVAAAALPAGALVALAARLRWGVMWYGLGERALRARYGLWKIHELTITYENVQNVEVSQGPLMRLFGIWKLDIQTAGGRGGAQMRNPMVTALLLVLQVAGSMVAGGGAAAEAVGSSGRSKGGGAVAATGCIYGLLEPGPVRERIMEKVRRSRSAGLGDDRPGGTRGGRAVGPEHVEVLRAIRDRLPA